MKKAAKAVVKRLEEYRKEETEQLVLFQIVALEQFPHSPYSNTVELYDAIPKYFWGKPERENGKYLPSIERQFTHAGKDYTVRITPARIQDVDGIERDYYPSQREEFVEDALRKLATEEGRGFFLDDRAGVVFSLNDLRRELKEAGHAMRLDQIKEALLVGKQALIHLTASDDKQVEVKLYSNIFETVGLATRDDWKGHGEKSRAFVRFNTLVTESIRSKTFRLVNYKQCMGYKSFIARQLHKRMSHNFRQAGRGQDYSILLSTIIRDFGLTQYGKLRNNLYKVEEALEEMKAADVIEKYTVDIKTANGKPGGKMYDALFIITASYTFTREVRIANRLAKDGVDGLLSHKERQLAKERLEGTKRLLPTSGTDL